MSAATEQKFIPDPTNSSSSRWYRSGDQGLMAPDGTVMFFGRISGDTQVKLRGLRIELAEVEGALLRAGESLLSTAVVTVRDGDLIAHIMLVPGKHVDNVVVKQKLLLSLSLPQYMHPARIIIVGDLPRANTGKIDRHAVAKLPLTVSGDVANESTNQLTLREVELKLLWRKVLPDPYQELTANAEFFLEGGNSLRLTQLQSEIRETMGVFLSTRELYSAPTLRQMAERIDSQRGEQTGNDEDINWDDEIAIPDELIALSKKKDTHARTPKTKGLKVMMTGGAGVLGNSILHALVQNISVDKIHCIAILPDEEHRIPDSDKVITYTGSLASPALGLSPLECEMLQTEIDLVIHAGGNGHCLNSYSSVRRPNVQSTHFLASLCLPRSVPLLYVSSQRVPALSGLKSLPPVPVIEEPGKTGDTGYMASRWVSERFLHKFSEYNNFMVEIHRPCLFYGDRAPKSDALNGVMTYTSRMRSIPRFKRVEGYIDFKNVDIIGRDIVSSAISLAGENNKGIRYRHHSSGRKVPFPQWGEYMEELTGEKFETLELPDWIIKARKAGIDPLISTYLEGVIEKEELGLFPYLGESLDE
jgi:aspyridone synthetase (hybrid polyketide synthase/nonribosomal peptide synthetase)